MEINVRDIFPSEYMLRHVYQEDYEKVKTIIQSVKTFAKSSHQYIYLLDYYNQKFIYTSDKLVAWCGKVCIETLQSDFRFFWEHIPEEDQKMIMEVNKIGIDFYNNLIPKERVNYTISFDFYFRNKHISRLVNHKLTPIMLAPDGHVWLALGVIEMSANKTSGNIMVQKEGKSSFYLYDYKKHSWSEELTIHLNEVEQLIITFSAQGYTVDEIANKICLSIDTTKGIKKKLFKKLGVSSIAEAITYAVNYRLI